MAPDQRYCVECGERRSGGGLRDALPRTAPVSAAPAPPRRAFAATTNSSLILGILTLLIAMGVGVLIGRSGDNGDAKSASATPQVVTVQTSGTGGGASTAAATTADTAASVKAAKRAAKKHKAASSSRSAAKTDVQKTAAKNGVKLPPAVVKVGQTCAKGTAGCSGGKFTGDYFGGG